MLKLNTQKTIKDIENNFLKKRSSKFLKLVIMLKLELKLLKVIKNEFNFMKELLLLKKIVQLIQQLLFEKYYKELVLNEFF
jgi:hypothetical protein